MTLGHRLRPVALSMLNDSTDLDIIKSHSEEFLSWLTQSKLLLVDLPGEIISKILGMLVDHDRTVFDKESSDIDEMSSTYRALQLSGTCRAFRSVLLDMGGAWAVVTSKQPGQAFLTMCVERSLDKGLRIYHRRFLGSEDSAVKLIRNLVSIQTVRHVRIHSISVEPSGDLSDVWTPNRGLGQPPGLELVQLLSKLDTSELNALDIHFFKIFRFENDGDEQEDDDSDNGDESDSDDTGSEQNGGTYDASVRSVKLTLRQNCRFPPEGLFMSCRPSYALQNFGRHASRTQFLAQD